MTIRLIGVFALLLGMGACKKGGDETSREDESADEERADDAGTEVTRTGPDDTAAEDAGAEESKYLSLEWAIVHNRLPGGEAIPRAEQIEHKKKSRKLRAEGYALYEKDRDAEALEKYERALEHWANGPLYYHYANSLSNIPRLADSIKAYEIAAHLGGHERPALVYYNTACAYSRMEKAEPAYEYLARAIRRGYNAFRYIEKDPDLEYLRSRPDWKERIQELVPQNVSYSREDLVGRVTVPTPRDPEEYTLCPGGRVIFESPFGSDDSCCGTTHHGEWSLEDGDLQYVWTERCSARGKGEPEPGGNCRIYPECTDEKCEPTDDEDAVYTLLTREEVAEMLGGDSAEEWAASLETFEGEPPDECP